MDEHWAAKNFQRGAADSGDADNLDAGIRHYVQILQSRGVETCQSCEGGEGHSYPEPTIEFWGTGSAGFHAVAVAMDHGLPIAELRRVWKMLDGELVGPLWAMTFSRKHSA